MEETRRRAHARWLIIGHLHRAFIDEETLVTQSVSTHKQPLSMLMAVLREGLPDSAIRLVGVQPKNTEFGCGMSAPVERAVKALVGLLLGALRRV
jgi:hydrogenase maturation protease